MKAIHGRLGQFFAWLSKAAVRISLDLSLKLLLIAHNHYEKAK